MAKTSPADPETNENAHVHATEGAVTGVSMAQQLILTESPNPLPGDNLFAR